MDNLVDIDDRSGNIKHFHLLSNTIHEDGLPVGCLIIGYNISDQVRNEKIVEKQFAALHNIAHNQSHIVRAPIAAMLGLINLMQQPEVSDVEKSDYLHKLHITVNQLDDIIKDIVMDTNI